MQLARQGHPVIWSVPRMWEGQTCAILAGGPSLQGFDAEVLRSLRVITINDSWRLAPWADLHYHCDESWIRAQKGIDLDSGKWVKGGVDPRTDPRVKVLRFTGQMGLDRAPDALRHGSNSGYQAIHLAYHLGVARILLLGYDMHVSGSRTHWHDEPRPSPSQFSAEIKQTFLPLFEYLVKPMGLAGIDIVNCTPGSALKCWPYMPLAEALETSRCQMSIPPST